MALINFKFDINQSEQEIGKRLMRALTKEISNRFSSNVDKIRDRAQLLTADKLLDSHTYKAMEAGTLKYELGVVNAAEKMQNVFVEIIKNIEVIFRPMSFSGDKFRGGIRVNIVKGDYSDILGLSDSYFITDKGFKIDWLDWLLLKGGAILVADYHVVFGRFKKSRTLDADGGALMFKKGHWGIGLSKQHSENRIHQGVENNNFITRALEEVKEPLAKDIIRCLS